MSDKSYFPKVTGRCSVNAKFNINIFSQLLNCSRNFTLRLYYVYTTFILHNFTFTITQYYIRLYYMIRSTVSFTCIIILVSGVEHSRICCAIVKVLAYIRDIFLKEILSLFRYLEISNFALRHYVKYTR